MRRERRQRRGVAVGEVPGEAGVGAQRLGRERHLSVGGRHLPRVDAEAEPCPPLPLAALEQEQDAVGGVELLAHALQRVLEQLVEVVHGTPAAEDVRAGLGELGAQLAYSVVVDRRSMRYESMTSAAPMITEKTRVSQRSMSSDPSHTNTNAESATATATANATARQLTVRARKNSGMK